MESAVRLTVRPTILYPDCSIFTFLFLTQPQHRLKQNLSMSTGGFPVPSHFLHFFQFPADYHVISISGSVMQLSAENLMNTAKYGTMRRPKAKRLSASGGLRPPDLLTRGSAPGPRWGLCPQTPVIGSRSRARHGCIHPSLAPLNFKV